MTGFPSAIPNSLNSGGRRLNAASRLYGPGMPTPLPQPEGIMGVTDAINNGYTLGAWAPSHTESGIGGAGYLGNQYKNASGDLHGGIDAHIDVVHHAPTYDPLGQLDAHLWPLPPTPLRRADGGPVVKGLPTLVGERGPEMLVKHPLHVNAPLLHGMADFQHLNPDTPTAAQAEDIKLAMHPNVPMPIRLPSLMALNPVGLPVPLPRRADGGPVRKGMPTLVGERGPEVIVPGQDGYVVPNEALNLSQTPDVYRNPDDPTGLILKPNQYDHGRHGSSTNVFPAPQRPVMPYTGTFQVDEQGAPLPDTFTFDGAPRVVPFKGPIAKGLPAPTSPSGVDGTNAEALPPMPGKSPFETVDEYNARQEAANPDGIIVGVTPRAPLTGANSAFARPQPGMPVESDSSGEPQLTPRAMRNVSNMLKNDPRMAMHLWLAQQNGKAAAERFNAQQQAQANARAETSRHNTATETHATNQEQAAKDKAQVAWQQKLYQDNYNETLKQLAASAKFESHQTIDPTTGRPDPYHYQAGTGAVVDASGAPDPRVVPVAGSNLGIAYSGNKRVAGMPTMTQSAPELPDFQTPGVNLPWMGGAGFPSLNVKGKPAQYAPMPKDNDPTGVKATKDHLAAIQSLHKLTLNEDLDPKLKAEFEGLIQQHLNAYKQGVGLPGQEGDVSKGAPARKPSAGFLGAVAQ